ncbi:FtsW/RodA/SpoVE family cell cycle protein, partial [uncultured Bilophila sp.]
MIMARRRPSSASLLRGRTEDQPTGHYDKGLLALFLMLLCIGLLMVLSASGVVAERMYGDKYFFFKRQLIYAAFGGVVMWVAAAMP